MILLNSPEIGNSALTIGTVLTTAGAIIGIMVTVIRDMGKRQAASQKELFDAQSESIKGQLQELNAHISELRTDIKNTNTEYHRLDKQMTEVRAILAANGCLSTSPRCDQTK